MGRASYDEETLAAYFHPPMAEIFQDPVAGPELSRLAAEDPDIIGAVAEVDRSQIRDCMRLTPWERLCRAVGGWNGIARFRRAG